MNETKEISRRKYTAEYKVKVALEAMQELPTMQYLKTENTLDILARKT